MSLFLGPIHHWMWKKIQFQNELNAHLFAEEDALIGALHERFGIITNSPLEEQIETSNIHGWLQEKVDLVENSFAFGIKEMLNTATVDALSISAEKFGMKQELPPAENTPEMYEIVQSFLLDGMPCDHVNEVLDQSDDSISWRQNQNIHAKYWLSNEADPEHYNLLRHSLIRGLLKESEYKFTKTDNNIYRIERRI